MSLKEKLGRFKSHMHLDTSATSATSAASDAHREPAGARQASSIDQSAQTKTRETRAAQWRALGATPYTFAGESVFVRERHYPLTYQHGRYRFEQLRDTIASWQDAEVEHPLCARGLTPEDLLFFDTETTGLQGGVGNAIFLLGTTRVTQDGVIMRQHFLPSPETEVALYHSFAQDLSSITHLVTYNGKSFDWPQVKTRHTLLRGSVPALPALGHFDLLHGARRLWREDLESCRLSLIEPEKLAVIRTEDIPGHMAPILYFDYLHSGDPTAIHGVLQHNEIDVLSLVTLYIHLSTLLLARGDTGRCTPEEQFAIARWYEALGQDEAAAALYLPLTISTHPLRKRALLALGLLYKRHHDWCRAIELLEKCVQDAAAHVPSEVFVELAKLHEHQMKDYEKALYYAKAALTVCKERHRLLRRPAQTELQAHERRIERLHRKLPGQSTKSPH